MLISKIVKFLLSHIYFSDTGNPDKKATKILLGKFQFKYIHYEQNINNYCNDCYGIRRNQLQDI